MYTFLNFHVKIGFVRGKIKTNRFQIINWELLNVHGVILIVGGEPRAAAAALQV